MKNEKAPHGEEYQELEKKKDIAVLNALKSVPFIAFNVFCTTSNLAEYEERKTGEDAARMLLVDREKRVDDIYAECQGFPLLGICDGAGWGLPARSEAQTLRMRWLFRG